MPRHPPCTLHSLISFMWVIFFEKLCFCLPFTEKLYFLNLIFFTHHCFALFNFQSAIPCSLEQVVGLSGLEPPTSRLSGVRSNRLSYKPICQSSLSGLSLIPTWWRWGGSNSWPPACKAGALPAELHPHLGSFILFQGFFKPWKLNSVRST